MLDPYIGYTTPEGAVLRARVLGEVRRITPDPDQSRWMNLRQMASLFFTDELAGVPVSAGGVQVLSDPDGYVRLAVPGPFPVGWSTVDLALEGQAPVPCPVLRPGPDARFLVISDIDDTVLETGAHNLARNLWTTFTGSAATRVVHRDAVDLLTALSAGGRNPVYYVSSSPWNMHHFLEEVFAAAGMPRGPMFLRDLGLPRRGQPRGHGARKARAIDTILAANPGLPAYLLGDTGQADAWSYCEAVMRHPGRIAGVALRESALGETADDLPWIARIEALGVPCAVGPRFDGVLARWGLA